MTGTVVLAAGGTGGHLVPAVAIAEAIHRLEPDTAIVFVGTSRALDDELVRGAGYTAYATSVRPFSRSPRGLLAPMSLVPASVQARRILRSARASVAVGMGGYPSVPVIVGARWAGVPSVIHEANAVPGLANETAAAFTRNVAISFEPA
ncbi:MAG TPA: glycosyltransferase, partial [Actinomycetota bacterium]|nr:glycosyltransferase [Actinomycetota bacterium]